MTRQRPGTGRHPAGHGHSALLSRCLRKCERSWRSSSSWKVRACPRRSERDQANRRVQNPEFYKKQSLRLSTHGTPRSSSALRSTRNTSPLPRGCVDEVRDLLRAHRTKIVIEDKRQNGCHHGLRIPGPPHPHAAGSRGGNPRPRPGRVRGAPRHRQDRGGHLPGRGPAGEHHGPGPPQAAPGAMGGPALHVSGYPREGHRPDRGRTAQAHGHAGRGHDPEPGPQGRGG